MGQKYRTFVAEDPKTMRLLGIPEQQDVPHIEGRTCVDHCNDRILPSSAAKCPDCAGPTQEVIIS